MLRELKFVEKAHSLYRFDQLEHVKIVFHFGEAVLVKELISAGLAFAQFALATSPKEEKVAFEHGWQAVFEFSLAHHLVVESFQELFDTTFYGLFIN